MVRDSSWRREVGTIEGTEIIEKGELIVGEIDMGRGLISPVPIDTRTVHICRSPVDPGIVPIPKSHDNVGAIPIPESRVDTGTVHAHVSMSTGVQTP